MDRREFNASFLFLVLASSSLFLKHLEMLVLMITSHSETSQGKSVHLALLWDCQQYGG